jgi:carbon dioxide concentrating mechanism protein CcmM
VSLGIAFKGPEGIVLATDSRVTLTGQRPNSNLLTPIVIGPGAAIDDRVTFHAVKGTDIRIGKFLVTDDDVVLHGPLEMGDRNFVGEDAAVFRVRLGDDVRIGEGAIVVGPDAPGDKIALEIPDDTIIPAGAVVTSEKDVRALKP